MPKLSKRWWTNIVAANLAVLLLLPVSSPVAATGQMATGQTAGQAAGETIRGKFGSQDVLQQNIVNPMTSSETPLETVDGSTAFPGQLSFPSSRKFLEVLIQPGPSGDLSTVIIGEDLNFDGTTDYSYQLPYPVSGVCGNGVISCTPGTWTDCQHYMWAADSTGRVSLQGTTPDNMGGCYCINSDCGNNLVWSNAKVILQDLGGGIVGSVQQANAGFTVSDVRLDNTTISYYGQDTSRTTDASGAPSAGSPVPPSQATFLTNPLAIPGKAQGLAMAQAGDSQSLYSLISGFTIDQEQVTCEVSRQITMSSHTSDQALELAGHENTILGHPVCDTEFLLDITDNVCVKPAAEAFQLTWWWCDVCTARLANYFFSATDGQLIAAAKLAGGSGSSFVENRAECHEEYSDEGPITVCNNYVYGEFHYHSGDGGPIHFELSGGRVDVYINPGDTLSYKYPGFYLNGAVVGFRGSGKPMIYTSGYKSLIVPPNYCVVELNILDYCAEVAARTDCSLQEEKVDGVHTYLNTNPTSLAPLPSSKTFTQGDCTETITQNWWRKERIYFCSSPAYDFSDTKTRYGQVIGSLTAGSSSASYQDMQRSNGGWASFSESIELMDLPDHDECEKACKTRRPTQDTQAVLAGHSDQFKTSTDSYDFLYHTCVNDLCPTEPGEEILKDCQCLNEFAEAATIMQMLRSAGQDTICSDGVAK